MIPIERYPAEKKPRKIFILETIEEENEDIPEEILALELEPEPEPEPEPRLDRMETIEEVSETDKDSKVETIEGEIPEPEHEMVEEDLPEKETENDLMKKKIVKTRDETEENVEREEGHGIDDDVVRDQEHGTDEDVVREGGHETDEDVVRDHEDETDEHVTRDHEDETDEHVVRDHDDVVRDFGLDGNVDLRQDKETGHRPTDGTTGRDLGLDTDKDVVRDIGHETEGDIPPDKEKTPETEDDKLPDKDRERETKKDTTPEEDKPPKEEDTGHEKYSSNREKIKARKELEYEYYEPLETIYEVTEDDSYDQSTSSAGWPLEEEMDLYPDIRSTLGIKDPEETPDIDFEKEEESEIEKDQKEKEVSSATEDVKKSDIDEVDETEISDDMVEKYMAMKDKEEESEEELEQKEEENEFDSHIRSVLGVKPVEEEEEWSKSEKEEGLDVEEREEPEEEKKDESRVEDMDAREEKVDLVSTEYDPESMYLYGCSESDSELPQTSLYSECVNSEFEDDSSRENSRDNNEKESEKEKTKEEEEEKKTEEQKEEAEEPKEEKEETVEQQDETKEQKEEGEIEKDTDAEASEYYKKDKVEEKDQREKQLATFTEEEDTESKEKIDGQFDVYEGIELPDELAHKRMEEDDYIPEALESEEEEIILPEYPEKIDFNPTYDSDSDSYLAQLRELKDSDSDVPQHRAYEDSDSDVPQHRAYEDSDSDVPRRRAYSDSDTSEYVEYRREFEERRRKEEERRRQEGEASGLPRQRAEDVSPKQHEEESPQKLVDVVCLRPEEAESDVYTSQEDSVYSEAVSSGVESAYLRRPHAIALNDSDEGVPEVDYYDLDRQDRQPKFDIYTAEELKEARPPPRVPKEPPPPQPSTSSKEVENSSISDKEKDVKIQSDVDSQKRVETSSDSDEESYGSHNVQETITEKQTVKEFKDFHEMHTSDSDTEEEDYDNPQPSTSKGVREKRSKRYDPQVFDRYKDVGLSEEIPKHLQELLRKHNVVLKDGSNEPTQTSSRHKGIRDDESRSLPQPRQHRQLQDLERDSFDLRGRSHRENVIIRQLFVESDDNETDDNDSDADVEDPFKITGNVRQWLKIPKRVEKSPLPDLNALPKVDSQQKYGRKLASEAQKRTESSFNRVCPSCKVVHQKSDLKNLNYKCPVSCLSKITLPVPLQRIPGSPLSSILEEPPKNTPKSQRKASKGPVGETVEIVPGKDGKKPLESIPENHPSDVLEEPLSNDTPLPQGTSPTHTKAKIALHVPSIAPQEPYREMAKEQPKKCLSSEALFPLKHTKSDEELPCGVEGRGFDNNESGKVCKGLAFHMELPTQITTEDKPCGDYDLQTELSSQIDSQTELSRPKDTEDENLNLFEPVDIKHKKIQETSAVHDPKPIMLSRKSEQQRGTAPLYLQIMLHRVLKQQRERQLIETSAPSTTPSSSAPSSSSVSSSTPSRSAPNSSTTVSSSAPSSSTLISSTPSRSAPSSSTVSSSEPSSTPSKKEEDKSGPVHSAQQRNGHESAQFVGSAPPYLQIMLHNILRQQRERELAETSAPSSTPTSSVPSSSTISKSTPSSTHKKKQKDKSEPVQSAQQRNGHENAQHVGTQPLYLQIMLHNILRQQRERELIETSAPSSTPSSSAPGIMTVTSSTPSSSAPGSSTVSSSTPSSSAPSSSTVSSSTPGSSAPSSTPRKAQKDMWGPAHSAQLRNGHENSHVGTAPLYLQIMLHNILRQQRERELAETSAPSTSTLSPGVPSSTLSPGVPSSTLSPGAPSSTLSPDVPSSTLSPDVASSTPEDTQEDKPGPVHSAQERKEHENAQHDGRAPLYLQIMLHNILRQQRERELTETSAPSSSTPKETQESPEQFHFVKKHPKPRETEEDNSEPVHSDEQRNEQENTQYVGTAPPYLQIMLHRILRQLREREVTETIAPSTSTPSSTPRETQESPGLFHVVKKQPKPRETQEDKSEPVESAVQENRHESTQYGGTAPPHLQIMLHNILRQHRERQLTETSASSGSSPSSSTASSTPEETQESRGLFNFVKKHPKPIESQEDKSEPVQSPVQENGHESTRYGGSAPPYLQIMLHNILRQLRERELTETSAPSTSIPSSPPRETQKSPGLFHFVKKHPKLRETQEDKSVESAEQRNEHESTQYGGTAPPYLQIMLHSILGQQRERELTETSAPSTSTPSSTIPSSTPGETQENPGLFHFVKRHPKPRKTQKDKRGPAHSAQRRNRHENAQHDEWGTFSGIGRDQNQNMNREQVFGPVETQPRVTEVEDDPFSTVEAVRRFLNLPETPETLADKYNRENFEYQQEKAVEDVDNFVCPWCGASPQRSVVEILCPILSLSRVKPRVPPRRVLRPRPGVVSGERPIDSPPSPTRTARELFQPTTLPTPPRRTVSLRLSQPTEKPHFVDLKESPWVLPRRTRGVIHEEPLSEAPSQEPNVSQEEFQEGRPFTPSRFIIQEVVEEPPGEVHLDRPTRLCLPRYPTCSPYESQSRFVKNLLRDDSDELPCTSTEHSSGDDPDESPGVFPEYSPTHEPKECHFLTHSPSDNSDESPGVFPEYSGSEDLEGPRDLCVGDSPTGALEESLQQVPENPSDDIPVERPRDSSQGPSRIASEESLKETTEKS